VGIVYILLKGIFNFVVSFLVFWYVELLDENYIVGVIVWWEWVVEIMR
jgi:hypothetical protein